MRKPMTFIIIAVIAIFSAIGGYFVYRYYQNRSMVNKSTVVEYRDFFCPKTAGFTFSYPVFKGWEPSLVDEDYENRHNRCAIFLNDHNSGATKLSAGYAPKIVVGFEEEEKESGMSDYFEDFIKNSKKNSHNVRYGSFDFFGKTQDAVIFLNQENNVIMIWLEGIKEQYGFSKEIFWKTVIESFRFQLNSKNATKK